MGVKGLASFVKDNQQSICKTVVLEQNGDEQQCVPIVVDAWGIIYQLWVSSLPWTSGGEYLRFYQLVHRLVSAWRSVGLEPIFMFDGSAPSSKVDTILSRLDDQLRAARLFYTTSSTSRSTPSFSRSCGKIILPPLASQTFNHALRDLGVETHFIPVGEADGACVALAEEREGYVFGMDSDYYVLIATVGLRKVRGYCPTDMMTWVDDEAQSYSGGRGQSNQGWSQPRNYGYGRPHNYGNSNSADAGWSTAAPRPRPTQRERSSPLLPPSDARNPKLILRVVTPNALRARLRLPPQMMPLFGALIGNDHTPREAQEHFFEPGLHGTAKVDRVARVLREVVFSPSHRNPGSMGLPTPSGMSTPTGSDAGDHAYQLVKRVMARLAQKPFLTEALQTEVTEGIIEATVQYALPSLAPCCGEYPFCGEVDRVGGCENAAKAWAEDAFEQEGEKAVVPNSEGRAAYATAQRRGLLNHATHVYLYPSRILMWQTMEDPSGPSLKAEEGARGVRTAAYLFVEQTLGTLRWEEAEEEEYTNKLARDEDPEVQMTQEEEDRAARHLLGVDTPINDADTSASSDTVVGPDDLEKALPIDQPPKRHMVEFARHTNRHMPFRIDLPPVLATEATALGPLQARLNAFLVPLYSDTPLIVALPPCLQPLAAYVRFSVIEASRRAGQYKWTAKEVEAVLKSAVGSFACWAREKTAVNKAGGAPKSSGDEPVPWPELFTRNSQVISQLTSIMTDGLYLAQALLLLPDVPLEAGMPESPIGTKRKVSGHTVNGSPDSPKTPKVDAQMPTLTHLTPFVFFSGITMHLLLSDDTPPGWQWSDRDEQLLQTLLTAVQEGLPGGTVKGWTGAQTTVDASSSPNTDGSKGAGAVPDSEDSSPKSRKEKKNKRGSNGKLGGKGDGTNKAPVTLGGRFDLLGADMA